MSTAGEARAGGRAAVDRGATTALAGPAAALFATLSRLRGRRSVHPHGVGFAATLTPLAEQPTGTRLFDSDRPRPAVVRLSRSLGLPETLLDPCGLALRIPEEYGIGDHQDFLLVTSGLAAGARHLPLPARGFVDRPYSTLLPYRIGGRISLLGAISERPAPTPTLSLADLRARDPADLGFRIIRSSLAGTWEPLARLELGARLPADEVEGLCFDPANTGGGIELAGFVNELRRPAYRASQRARGARP